VVRGVAEGPSAGARQSRSNYQHHTRRAAPAHPPTPFSRSLLPFAVCRADRSGQDDDCNWEHGQFDQETASLVLRVLTAKVRASAVLSCRVVAVAAAVNRESQFPDCWALYRMLGVLNFTGDCHPSAVCLRHGRPLPLPPAPLRFAPSLPSPCHPPQATQRLLIQLEELDLHKARWMNHYCSEHPPNQGNKVSGRRWALFGECGGGAWTVDVGGVGGYLATCTCWHQREVLPYSCIAILTPFSHTFPPRFPLRPAPLPPISPPRPPARLPAVPGGADEGPRHSSVRLAEQDHPHH
jgi:hypothetical protein